ncbi:MAG TPA: immunoglobulin-like domain-containing protein, partial [Candidatus Izemoplasmatales bacterium]|nr:immunoglobulin-like domain-containing protein [Candidatus Izemoplasmatales bacterium]
VDVTATVDLRFNKVFEAIEDVETFTSNNTNELTDDEVLTYYIKMYNVIYGEYRTPLDETANTTDLVALDNEFFAFNYDEVNNQNASLADYLFSDISQLNEKTYAAEPRVIGDFAYMVYKLQEPSKIDLKTLVMDIIEDTINLPEVTNTDISLPTEGPYSSTINWTSSEDEIIENDGTIIVPDEDTLVSLQYTINVLGVSHTGVEFVRVPSTASETTETTSEETSLGEYTSLKTLIDNDTLYQEIETILLENKLEESAILDDYMVEARQNADFKINDYYVAMNYRFNYDADFEFGKGDSEVLASIDADGERFDLTAESFYQSALDRNPTLMIFYASQLKEAIHSDDYKTIFGNETDIEDNESERMEALRDSVQNFENLYNFLIQQRDTNPQMYNYYKMVYGVSEANFDSYQLFIYSALNVRTETEILENYVLDELRLSFVKDVLDDVTITNDIYEVAEDNYNNYFSLKAEHILIHIDYDEDGSPDDYDTYFEGLSTSEQTDLNTLLSGLETTIRQQDSSLESIVESFRDAKRDDEDWGVYKQAGFLLKYESLNPTNRDDEESSITYMYAKNTFVDAFTNKLIELYEDYQDPLNVDEESLLASKLVETQFGLHLIEVTKDAEDNLEGISFEINEDDYETISDGLLNDQPAPTLTQIETYFSYKIYETFYSLDDIDVESIYDIELPEIPADVLEDFDAITEESLEPIFGNYMVNYALLLHIQDGETQSDITQTVFEDNVELLLDIYRSNTIDQVGLEDE